MRDLMKDVLEAVIGKLVLALVVGAVCLSSEVREGLVRLAALDRARPEVTGIRTTVLVQRPHHPGCGAAGPRCIARPYRPCR